jgi:hypothetical protein
MKKKIKPVIGAAVIALLLATVVPFAVRFVSARIYSLDTSDIRGSILFGPYSERRNETNVGIWRLRPATGKMSLFFSEDDLLPEYEDIESFAYSSDHGILLVSAAKTLEREDGIIRYKLFAEDKRNGGFILAKELDYTTSEYEHCELYYIKPLSLFAVLRGEGVDFMDPEDGEIVSRTELNFKPRTMDWNDDFTYIVYDTGKETVLLDGKGASEKTLQNNRMYSPVFTAGFNEVVFHEFYDSVVRKHDVKTGREDVLCSLEDFAFSGALHMLTPSPDRKHVAAFCGGKKDALDQCIVLIDTETGKKALSVEQVHSPAVSKIQWTDE